MMYVMPAPYDITRATRSLRAIKAALAKETQLTSIEALSQAAVRLKTVSHPHRLRMAQMLLPGWDMVRELLMRAKSPVT